MGVLVNIDNGGTFTDVCVRDGERVVHAKSPTTPHDLTQCFVGVLTRVSRELYGEEDLSRFIRDIDYIRYSTTSGTNAVVERKGTPLHCWSRRAKKHRSTVSAKTRRRRSVGVDGAHRPGRHRSQARRHGR